MGAGPAARRERLRIKEVPEVKAALIGDAPLAERKERKVCEADVEEYLVKEVAKRGGVAEKFSSPNRSSVPDRLVQWPGVQMTLSVVGALVDFVECKAPGKAPTAAQARDHERRRAMGFRVYVLDSYEAVDRYIKETGR
jgi:hypothetical protein